MNKKKTKKIITLLVSIIAIVGMGSLIAFLTDTDTETNVFTMGKVDIELLEPNWNESNGEDILPGQPISKDPKIKNIGNNPAYVYMKVVNPVVDLATGSTGVLFNYTINSGWTMLDEVEECDFKATTYYYNTSLNPNASTTTLFDSITVNEFNENIGETQSLDVYAYGIQSTYLQSGSTIQSLFTSTFTTSLSDTDKSCNSVTDCNNNTLYTTVPPKLKGLAKIMAENSYLDNGKSGFVTSCEGIKFDAISSDTNGKGIYEISSTKNDTYPIYYYRGAVDNNNVKFANFCWKAIRTTDTGGVKLIYNGSPDGSGNCSNTTGTNTQIGTSKFRTIYTSLSDVGYMYGTRYSYSSKASSSLNTPYVYGNDVTYSGGAYTLKNTMTSTGTWSNDYNTLNNNHYTCFSVGATCSNVYYIYYTDMDTAYYITLTNGKKVSDALDEMFNESNINTTDSTAKTAIDTWYNSNLSSYTPYIEDTVYCNDRSISELNGWNPNGGDITKNLNFSPRTRASTNYSPSLVCSRSIDKFTVSSSKGNGKLTYPVGLITSDEVMYSGGQTVSVNRTWYLYTNQEYWYLSPAFLAGDTAREMEVGTDGQISNTYVYITKGIRPVISLKSTDIVESGDGTQTNPYVIKTN